MRPAIRVENLSKRYQLGLTHAASVRELVNGVAARLFGRGRAVASKEEQRSEGRCDLIWALRDVSFEVNSGEAIGIIGRNGAGKSTLLKVLSRITRPTDGRIELQGRVASLLEVGTGFHPELTGRENVYMNGTILGMTKREIKREFDSIVGFAEVERFIDTPVKRYSSGMTVRLGFAVAAHLNPEILIVDEVLAVGDADFQRRCLGKMDDIARSGRTVLFVSHNMSAIRKLTSQTVVIADGRLSFNGRTEDALDHYLSKSTSLTIDPLSIANMARPSWCGDQQVKFTSAEVLQAPVRSNEPIVCRLGVKSSRSTEFCIGVTLYSADGNPVAAGFSETLPRSASGTTLSLDLQVHNPGLAPGRYWFTLGILRGIKDVLDVVEEVLHFEVPDDAVDFAGLNEWNRAYGAVQLPMKVVVNEKNA